jgi:hypothetical protein
MTPLDDTIAAELLHIADAPVVVVGAPDDSDPRWQHINSQWTLVDHRDPIEIGRDDIRDMLRARARELRGTP